MQQEGGLVQVQVQVLVLVLVLVLVVMMPWARKCKLQP